MKRLLLITLSAVLLIGLLTACGGSSSKNETESNVLRVGMECDYPPYNWSQKDDSNGAVKVEGSNEYANGYDVQIAKKIAEGLGKELVVIKTSWEGLVPALDSETIDVIIAGMSPLGDRREVIDFSDYYWASDLVMVVKRGSEYENASSLSDFSGAKVSAQSGTLHYTVIDQIPGVEKDVALESFPTLRVSLESGIIDAYVSERPEAVSAKLHNEDLTFVELEDGFETDNDETAVAVGVKKGSELTAEINEILKDISEDERLELMDRCIKMQDESN
ncbi:MAG: transporter substrate-binding domain-containing protein [Tissierellia bacterium]|nr:transporter substrate-binding domain-containing protein [Tissierellia bacterium]